MTTNSQLEFWGGIECTINRIQDSYIDQLEYAGHYERHTDVEMIADLGFKKIRYPVLWERHQPTKETKIDWTGTELALNKLRSSNIDPIAGLVHHGSGPQFATIESDNFAESLAGFAYKVAEKFPWLNYYTPVNEPLTTARFCGLYGLWYPHNRSDRSFIQLLMNETKATILAMKAIRSINPNAKLIQTEDLGKTYSSKLLKYQADFENLRRWLSIDLLSGKVDRNHPLWKYLSIDCSIPENDLLFFVDNPCTPDILGFNYYLTSERFIDENLKNYPEHTHGGNKKHRYADVEAIRVDLDLETGCALLLKEAWEKFKIPMAITEVHLGCSREEQLRWMMEIWETGKKLRKDGVDLKAITAWALLGSFGWNKLLTQSNGLYECGVFDLSNGKPRPTAMAKMIKAFSKGESFNHPVIETPGWWKKDMRVLYFQNNIRKMSNELKCSQPLLILGKNGTLGRAFAKLCDLRGIYYQLLDRTQMDLSSRTSMENTIAMLRPWAIVNAAGYVRVDDAETDQENCFMSNSGGPAQLAEFSAKYGFKLVTFSSDLVFDGSKSSPYLESDEVAPLNIYGQSKAKSEKSVLELDPSALIIRTSAFFSPWDDYNFITNVITSLKNGHVFKAANDVFISPTYVPDLVNRSLDLLLDDESGIWHLSNQGEITWASLALKAAERAGCDSKLIASLPLSAFAYPAKRPLYSVLGSERGLLMPTLTDSLDRYFNELPVVKNTAALLLKSKVG